MLGRTFHDNVKLDKGIVPQALNGASATTDWYDIRGFGRAVFIIAIGDTDTTVDASVYQATDGTGTGSKAISGGAITQVAADGDNRVVTIEVKPENLDFANGFRYVQLKVTAGSGTTGAHIAAPVLFYRAGDAPVTQPSNYAEAVTV